MTSIELAAWQGRMGFSQIQAARRLGMPVQTYRNLIKGRRHAESIPGPIAQLCEHVEQTTSIVSSAATLSHSVLSVTAQEVKALNESEMVELLQRLLYLEAAESGLLASGVHVPAQIHVGDGGEDGRIEWVDGPSHTQFLPGRLVLFQVKATEMTPAKCSAELTDKNGKVKSRVRTALNKGATYIIFCNRPSTQQQIENRLIAMRQTFNTAGLTKSGTVKLDFWDANKIAGWVNFHYPVALWLLEHVRPGGVLPFRSLDNWANDKSVADFSFVSDSRIEGVSARISQVLNGSKSVMRLVGPSGLGKTRLALEAFRASSVDVKSRVLYARSTSVGENVLRVVEAIREQKKSAIVVVDDCPLQLHKQLAEIVQHTASQLSLLTIDYDSEGGSVEDVTLKVDRAEDRVIIGIIRQIAPLIEDNDANRLARFAQGFPQVGVLIARAWPFNVIDISSLTDKVLVEKMVFGRRAADQQLLRVARALSLYDIICVEGKTSNELEFAASFAGVDFEVAYEHLRTLKENGIARQRGRFVRIEPRPLALSLAAYEWKRLLPKKVEELQTKTVPTRLRVALFRQFSKLDRVNEIQEIAAGLCARGEPFSNAFYLDGNANAECLAYISEVNPSAVMGALERAFGSLSSGQLKEIRQGRRWLVWTLERLCFRIETFQRAAKLMLDFAVAENEEIGNNATQTFKEYFKLYLSGTETPALERLLVLDNALKSRDPKCHEIVVDALGRALETNHFSRIGGPDVQGSGPTLIDWHPDTTSDILAYYRACINRLSDVACNSDGLRRLAMTNIARHIRGLLGQGLVDEIALAANRILAVEQCYWSEAIAQTSQSLSFEGPKMPPEYRKKVEVLHDSLLPRSLEERLRFYICQLPTGYFDPERKSVEAGVQSAKMLAAECVSRWDEFLTLIPMFLSGEQRYTNFFGQDILQAAPDREQLIDLVITLLKAVPKDSQNPALLAGLLHSADKEAPSMVDRKLELVASDSDLIRFLPWFTMLTNVEARDLQRIVVALRAGNLDPQTVRTLSWGRVLLNISPAEIGSLIDALVDVGSAGIWVAIEILGMYTFQNHHLFEDLRKPVTRMLTMIELCASENSHGGGDAFHFDVIVKWLISHGSSDEDAATVAAHLTEQVVKWCVVRPPNHVGSDAVEGILPDLLIHCHVVAWPILSSGIVEHRSRIWCFESLLGSSSIEGKSIAGPIFLVPWEELRAWGHRYPDFAPAFLMRIAPAFEEGSTPRQASDRSWNRIVRDLLDEFGDRQDVLSALSNNMMTFCGWGSLVPYHKQYQKPLQNLLSHYRPSVAAWARSQLEIQERFIRNEVSRDEEKEFGVF